MSKHKIKWKLERSWEVVFGKVSVTAIQSALNF